MTHDRIHAREPAHDRDRFTVGVIEALEEGDGHCVVTVTPARATPGDEAGDDGPAEPVELVVTLAVRDLFVDRLDLEEGASPVGERVWYREHGG